MTDRLINGAQMALNTIVQMCENDPSARECIASIGRNLKGAFETERKAVASGEMTREEVLNLRHQSIKEWADTVALRNSPREKPK